MGFDTDFDIEVTGRASILARLPFASQTELHAIVDTRGDFDFEFSRATDDALSATIGALVANDRPTTTARRTRCLNPEESLRLDDLAAPVAIVAFLRLRPRFGAAAMTCCARNMLFDL